MFTGLFNKKNEEITVESLKKKKPKYEDLQGVLYFHGGGMEGSDHRVELKKEDDGTLSLTFCDSSDPGQAVRVLVYEADPSLLEQLDAYVREYNLSVWDELSESEYQVLDAPSTHLYLYFNDPDTGYLRSVRIDYDREFPEGGYAVVNGFVSLLAGGSKDAVYKETYLETWNEDRIYTGKDIENNDEEIRELLLGCWTDGKTKLYVEYDDTIRLITEDEEGSRTFVFKQIVHECYEDLDSSWYAVAVNVEEEEDQLIMAIDGYRMYIGDGEKIDTFLVRK